MMECGTQWREVIGDRKVPLEHLCRCIRLVNHEGAHECVCVPRDMFTMRTRADRHSW